MNTKLVLLGSIYAVAKKSYKEEETIYAQFLNKKEDGTIDIQKVKMTDKNDILTIKEGQNIKIPVLISSYEGKLYFTQSEAIIKG